MPTPRWLARQAGKRSMRYSDAPQQPSQACSDEGAGSLIVVSHADVVRAILGHYLHIDLQLARHMRIDHASLTALDLNGSEADLLFLNFTPSLTGIP